MTLLLKSQCSEFAKDPADIIEVSDLLDACFRIFFEITEASDVLDARFRMLFVACVGP